MCLWVQPSWQRRHGSWDFVGRLAHISAHQETECSKQNQEHTSPSRYNPLPPHTLYPTSATYIIPKGLTTSQNRATIWRPSVQTQKALGGVSHPNQNSEQSRTWALGTAHIVPRPSCMVVREPCTWTTELWLLGLLLSLALASQSPWQSD